tara:strand:- start:11 stop:922 length:912 start_codon:yes stop_codon:yes gene_type:complete
MTAILCGQIAVKLLSILNMKHIRLQTINLKTHNELNEKWLQEVIAEDPSIIGLGDVILKDKERIQTGAGRLDLLMQDTDGNGRYEIEIQLGSTDESHIIRTIEYWDIERRRYPQYDHTAVIIAEDITSRFLNVISLFNGFIPLMALQVTAIKTEEGVGLQFTKVLDTVTLGMVDEDEDVSEVTDRDYWLKRATPKTVGMVDKIFDLSKDFIDDVELNYTKHYIGFKVNNRANNFSLSRPQKGGVKLSIRLPKSEETSERISSAELDILNYWRGMYQIRLTEKELRDNKEVISQLMKEAFDLKK